jgi:uncharacterized membrane protein
MTAPNAAPDRHVKDRKVYFLTLAGSVVWMAFIFLAPYLRSRGAAAPAAFIYAVYANVCHQIPARSFHLAGQPLAVCGRCLGIYAGLLAGLLALPLARRFPIPPLPRPRTFVLFTLPIAVDSLAGLIGVWRSPIGVRFLTGLVWGSLLPGFLLPGLRELLALAHPLIDGLRLTSRKT